MNGRRKRRPPIPDPPGGALDVFVADTHLDGLAFLARYRRLRARGHHRSQPHKVRAIAVATELLKRHPRVTQQHIGQLLGGNKDRLPEAQRAICDALGRPVKPYSRATSGTAGAEATLKRWLAAELGPLPLTCLDADLGDKFSTPEPGYCVRALALRHPLLQLNAAFGLLLDAAARMPGHYVTRDIKAWESLDDWVATTGVSDALSDPARRPRMLEAWLKDAPCLRRLSYWRRLAVVAERINDYLNEYPLAAERLAGRFLRIPRAGKYQEARRVSAVASEAKRQRRATTAGPIADHLPELIELVDARVEEVTAVRDAFDAVRQQFHASGVKGIKFAVSLPRTASGGGSLPGIRTLEFEMVDTAALERRFGPISHQLHPQVPSERIHLVFLGVRDADDADDVVPIFEAYRRGVFVSPACLSDEQEDALCAWAAAAGRMPSFNYRTLFRYRSGHDRELADRAFKAGLVLIPITMLHHAFAIACAVTRSGLLSGARISETLQQIHGDQSFGWTADGQFFFVARPKWKTGPERFYLHEPTLIAILRVIDVAERNGDPIIELVWAGAKDAKPRRYIYQSRGRPIRLNVINAALQIMLFGYPMTSHDLRHAFGRFSKNESLGERRIQAGLHHAHPSSTSCYTQPTERMKADLVRLLALRADLPRSASGVVA